MTDLLSKAISIATKAHENQVDKGGQPYILHPLRVMMQMKTNEERIVAVLHDSIEDSSLSIDDLESFGFSINIIDSIEKLSKKQDQDYDKYIENISKDEIARRVKIADIKDNMNISRLSSVTRKDLERLKKYHMSLQTLLSE